MQPFPVVMPSWHHGINWKEVEINKMDIYGQFDGP